MDSFQWTPSHAVSPAHKFVCLTASCPCRKKAGAAASEQNSEEQKHVNQVRLNACCAQDVMDVCDMFTYMWYFFLEFGVADFSNIMDF